MKVARTVADLTGLDEIDAGCLREAAAFRPAEPAEDPLAIALEVA